MRVFVVLALALIASADVYMHNMRGSNDRLNENNQDRNNGNRLFDSQNNNRGGYNVGDMNAAQDGLGVMQYYSSSNLLIEWTNQHGGGPNPNVNSAIILQYMCNDNTAPYDNANLRDGTTTTTVTNDNQNSGRHETMQFYTDCTTRSRNFGLFVADQLLQGKSAIYTRQNPNGDRHGYECPEERDYYPYWAPSPWRDIAIITSNTTLCEMYQATSQNVAPRYYCSGFTTTTDAPVVPITSAACTAGGGTWTQSPAFGIPAPDCVAMGWSRDNHLGNTVGGQPLNYNWVIPSIPQVGGSAPVCVLRMRYNISTNDYDGWNTFADKNGVTNSPVTQDPDVNFGEGQHVIVVKLAINTNQYGRTFQDRSHTFTVLPRPNTVPAGSNLYNLNVRGRRGNIVQVYPAVEYDFIPNRLTMGTKDYVHIQWTGSLNTPDGAGQGTASTDRSNIVCVVDPNHNYPLLFNDTRCNLFTNLSDQERFATVGLTSGGTSQLTFNALLNDRPAYYNGGVLQPGGGAPGTYNYMCTRNNNFSNRSQKGWITVA